MKQGDLIEAERAERRAAPKPARIPSGDRLMYPSGEGPTSTKGRFLLEALGAHGAA